MSNAHRKCLVSKESGRALWQDTKLGNKSLEGMRKLHPSVSPIWSGEITHLNDEGPCSLMAHLFSQITTARSCLTPCPCPNQPLCSPCPAGSRSSGGGAGGFPLAPHAHRALGLPWQPPVTSLGLFHTERPMRGPQPTGPAGGLLTLLSFSRSPSGGMPNGATSRKSITWLWFFRMSWTSITPPLW